MHLTVKQIRYIIPLSLLAMMGYGFTLLQTKSTKPSITITVSYDSTKFASADTIIYTKSKRLQWDDFLSVPPVTINNENTVANSGVGFKFNASIQKVGSYTTINIKISSFFVKPKSWVLADSKNEYILNHEQKHYDIARYGAELLRQNFLKAKFNSKNISPVLSAIYNNTWNTYLALQNQYDRETNHSINKEQQEIWNTKIAAMMEQIQY